MDVGISGPMSWTRFSHLHPIRSADDAAPSLNVPDALLNFTSCRQPCPYLSIRLSDLDELERKAETTKQIRLAATTDANTKIRQEGLPDAVFGHCLCPYISLAGSKSRYGVQARWEMVRKAHNTQGPRGPQEDRGARVLCDTCKRGHHSTRVLPDLVDVIRCEERIPPGIRAYHEYVICLIRQQMFTTGYVDTSAIYANLEILEWPGQQPTATRATCTLYQRLLRHRKTEAQAKIATTRVLDAALSRT